MSREKQIEENEQIKEMAEDLMICHVEIGEDDDIRTDYEVTAALMYKNRGYRKQSVGEWETIQKTKTDIITECTACKKQFWFMKKGQLNIDRMPYCPNCGAKMKGGAE